jgi:ribosomal protein L17
MAGESKNYPKKYWWVVLVALPVALALVAIVPQLIGGSGAKPAGDNGVSIVGSNNTVTIDNSTQMTVINNISVIAQEYQKYTGQALSEDLKQLIERAVAAATKNDHAASVRLYEQVANQVPVPAIFNNLAVEYAKTNNVAASQQALTQAIQKDPANEVARKNLALIAPARRTAVAFASGGWRSHGEQRCAGDPGRCIRRGLCQSARRSRRRYRSGNRRRLVFHQVST